MWPAGLSLPMTVISDKFVKRKESRIVQINIEESHTSAIKNMIFYIRQISDHCTQQIMNALQHKSKKQQIRNTQSRKRYNYLVVLENELQWQITQHDQYNLYESLEITLNSEQQQQQKKCHINEICKGHER